ncbi:MULTISPECIES: hypothetical protein [Vibrio]|jgi:hypothetical protein|uniref:Uncharacterized protein n=1 Tax=Vibrio kanaloae TaxID=170673 RepID=A0ABV4LKI6_9VIBR|nr:hypothetical protein [Vibrio kanaloae]NOJ00132.1 hypothetical protein [Vibrio kanaloae]
MMKTKLSLIFLPFCLVGCVNMQELDSVNKGKYLVLERDLTRIRTGGALGIKGLLPTSWVEGVSSGVYVTEGQDSQGIFYRSVNCCIGLENKRKMVADMHGWDCGIRVPYNKNEVVRSYYHDDGDILGMPYEAWYAEFTYDQFESTLKKQ